MRWIDRWIGIPLCFFASLAETLFQRIASARPSRSVKKIAFIKLSELGAILLAYPLMRSMKEKFPKADLFFLTFARNAEVFGLFPGLIRREDLLLIREDSFWHFLSDVFLALNRLRRERVDILFDLEFFSRASVLLAYFSGALKRIGFDRYTFEGLYRGRLLTHKVQYNPHLHVAESYEILSQAADQEKKESPEFFSRGDAFRVSFPEYRSVPGARESILKKLGAIGIGQEKRIYLVNPGEGMLPLREWPLENFVSLAGKILEDERNAVLVVGTETAHPKAALFLSAADHPHCRSLVGETRLQELMELFQLSRALITNDCGLAHLAMLTPVKKFIFFGPESPKVFAPLTGPTHIFYTHFPCSPCLSALNHRESACRDNRCLKAITPEEVFRSVQAAN